MLVLIKIDRRQVTGRIQYYKLSHGIARIVTRNQIWPTRASTNDSASAHKRILHGIRSIEHKLKKNLTYVAYI